MNKILALMIALVLSVPAWAQEDVLSAQDNDKDSTNKMSNVVNFNIGLQLGFPTGEYKNQNDEVGFGIGGNLAFNIKGAPLYVGIDGAYLVMSSRERVEQFSTTIPDVRVRVNTTNSHSFFHGFLRFQADEGPIQPYFEGLIGFNYLSTTTTIEDVDFDDDQDIASSNDLSDFAFSYGVGGGLAIPVSTFESEEGHGMQLLIDLGAKYIKGGEAEYLKEDGKQIVDGEVIYEITKSRTDMLSARIGVTLKF
ncbi:MAG: hypothetical protein ACLFR2_06030 [Candidatus Kapaibacterium sp.]